MNKMLLSTLKVLVLFSVSTFFAYMILKAQIKSSSKTKIHEKSQEQVSEKNEDLTKPVLTYVSSTKAEVSAIELSDEGLDLVIEPKPQKQYVKLEKDTLDENGKVIEEEFFHSSKAPLTTVALEIPEDDEVYVSSSKAAPIEIDLRTEEEKFSADRDLQIQIFQLEDQVRALQAKIKALKESRE